MAVCRLQPKSMSFCYMSAFLGLSASRWRKGRRFEYKSLALRLFCSFFYSTANFIPKPKWPKERVMCPFSGQNLTTSTNYVFECACVASSSLLLHIYDSFYENIISPRSRLFEREITTSYALPLLLLPGRNIAAKLCVLLRISRRFPSSLLHINCCVSTVFSFFSTTLLLDNSSSKDVESKTSSQSLNVERRSCFVNLKHLIFSSM
jgi:hypothetical protein